MCGGFTLIELVVYMAIMGFIIIVAGRVFSDSTKMRIRSQNMIASAEEAGRVSALIKEDVSQMGAKSWKNPSDGSFKVAKGVYNKYNDPQQDLSSYKLLSDEKGIEFKKVLYKNDGTCRAVLKITWELDAAKNLYRKCEPITDSDCTNTLGSDTELECPTSIVMATGVTTFKFETSKSGTAGLLFPPEGSTGFSFIVNKTNSSPTLFSGNSLDESLFVENNSTSESNHTDFYLTTSTATNTSSCWSYSFKADEEYTIDFDLPCTSYACRDASKSLTDEPYNSMTMFQPGKDHLFIGLRKPDMNGDPFMINNVPVVPDFLFYPPQDTNANKIRHFEFSVPKTSSGSDITACIGITAAFYTEAANGHLEIENIKVSRKTDEVYNFSGPSGGTQADVKAFKLTLKIEKGAKVKEISEAVTVIPVPNNGVVP